MNTKRPVNPDPLCYADIVDRAVVRGELTPKEGIKAKKDVKRKFYQSKYTM